MPTDHSAVSNWTKRYGKDAEGDFNITFSDCSI